MISIGDNMNPFRKISDYIYDNEMTLHLYDNKVSVINYKEISSFASDKIVIKYNKGSITIVGNKLVVSTMLDNEMLISGEVKKIELG